MTLSYQSNGLLVAFLASSAICCSPTTPLRASDGGGASINGFGQRLGATDSSQTTKKTDGNGKTSFQQQLKEATNPPSGDDVCFDCGADSLLRRATSEELDEAVQLASSLSESNCWSREDTAAAIIIDVLWRVDKQRALNISDRLLDAEGTSCAARRSSARVLVNSRGKTVLERLVTALERSPERFVSLADSIRKAAGECGDPSFSRVVAVLNRVEKSTNDLQERQQAAQEREWFERQIILHAKADAGSGQ